MIHIQCPSCQSLCAVNEAMLGKRVHCPNCHEIFNAPTAAGGAATATPAAPGEGVQAGPAPSRPSTSVPPPLSATPAPRTVAQRPRSLLPWILGGLAAAMVLLCGISILGGAILWAYFAAAPARQPDRAVAQAGAVDAPVFNGDPVWTLDLRKMQPPNRPLAGKMLGANYQANKVELVATGLSLHSGNDWVHIFLKVQPGQDVYEYAANNPNFGEQPAIHLHINSTNPPGHTVYTNGYAMRVELGKAQNGRTPGKLYLCLPDERKSVIAGTFSVDAR
jgi:predicted Zn finger-like uncharacterized protein